MYSPQQGAQCEAGSPDSGLMSQRHTLNPLTCPGAPSTRVMLHGRFTSVSLKGSENIRFPIAFTCPPSFIVTLVVTLSCFHLVPSANVCQMSLKCTQGSAFCLEGQRRQNRERDEQRPLGGYRRLPEDRRSSICARLWRG